MSPSPDVVGWGDYSVNLVSIIKPAEAVINTEAAGSGVRSEIIQEIERVRQIAGQIVGSPLTFIGMIFDQQEDKLYCHPLFKDQRKDQYPKMYAAGGEGYDKLFRCFEGDWQDEVRVNWGEQKGVSTYRSKDLLLVDGYKSIKTTGRSTRSMLDNLIPPTASEEQWKSIQTAMQRASNPIVD